MAKKKVKKSDVVDSTKENDAMTSENTNETATDPVITDDAGSTVDDTTDSIPTSEGTTEVMTDSPVSEATAEVPVTEEVQPVFPPITEGEQIEKPVESEVVPKVAKAVPITKFGASTVTNPAKVVKPVVAKKGNNSDIKISVEYFKNGVLSFKGFQKTIDIAKTIESSSLVVAYVKTPEIVEIIKSNLMGSAWDRLKVKKNK